MTEVRHGKSTRVQVAPGWPSGDAGWTTLRGTWVEAAEEGAGQIVGSASFRQLFGLVQQPGDNEVYHWGLAPDYGTAIENVDIIGQYVRLLLEDAAGSVTVGTKRFTPFWHGIITGREVEPDGGSIYPGGSCVWECLGIAALLDHVFVHGGFEVAADGTTVVDPGWCPPFNDLPFGDSTDTIKNMGNGSTYVFNRGEAGTKERWRVSDIIELVLHGYANVKLPDSTVFAGGLTWQLGVGISLLDFAAGRFEAQGRTVLSIVNEFINPRRGFTWRTRIAGRNAFIDVFSVTENAITVGAATIPAAGQVHITITDDVWKNHTRLRQDPIAHDLVRVIGGWALAAMTLAFKAGQAGSEWALIPTDDWVPADSPSLDPTAQSTWRTFRINPAWGATNYQNSAGLRHQLSADGTRTQGAGNPQVAVLRLDRLTPLGANFTTETYGPRNEPVVVIGSGTSWTDYSSQISVTVTQDPAGIMLGIDFNDAFRLKALLEDGTRTLLITVGVYEWAPLQTWWQRPVGEWPRDLPRVWSRSRPEVTQKLVFAGTVSGCVSGALQVQPSTVIFRDDVPVLQSEQACAQARFGGFGGADVTWTEQGLIDIGSTYGPGAFIGVLITGERSWRVMSPITRRSWVFTEQGYGTTYSTERVPVDIEPRP